MEHKSSLIPLSLEVKNNLNILLIITVIVEAWENPSEVTVVVFWTTKLFLCAYKNTWTHIYFIFRKTKKNYTKVMFLFTFYSG